MATGASEKLAQEGLRGNCDWLAVGERVGSGVGEVAHDLESVHGESLRKRGLDARHEDSREISQI